jgi:hypothetical protein
MIVAKIPKVRHSGDKCVDLEKHVKLRVGGIVLFNYSIIFALDHYLSPLWAVKNNNSKNCLI